MINTMPALNPLICCRSRILFLFNLFGEISKKRILPILMILENSKISYLNKISFICSRSSSKKIGPFGFSMFDVSQNLFKLFFINLRTLFISWIIWISNSAFFCSCNRFLNEFLKKL